MRKFRAEYLSRLGLKAATIFDIGVGQGTPPLYKAFGDRKIVLIDPQAGVKEALHEKRPKTKAYDFHAVGLAASPGTATLHVYRGSIGRTSFSGRPNLSPRTSYTVPVTTLDRLVEENGYSAPFGIKIDTEGHELEVLRGARQTLQATEFVICEVSTRKRFVQGYKFSEIIALMAESGFEVIDVLNVEPGVPKFLDCLFVRSDHPLLEAGAASDTNGSSDD
jgi:FkbM family methyltransferase